MGMRTMVCRLNSSSSCFFSVVFTPSPKRKPSGRTTAARPSVVLEQVHDERQEEVGGLSRLMFGKKVLFDAILFHASEWWDW